MTTCKMDDFLQKLKKVVRIVLYGPANSQSDCRKAGPYKLPFNKPCYRLGRKIYFVGVGNHFVKICLGYEKSFVKIVGAV